MSAIELSLAADTSDGVARGYPATIRLGGEITMEGWQPAEAVVEARTLRAVSDVEGPSIHGRVRSLLQEEVRLLVPDSQHSRIEQASRLLNAINGGEASGWLQAQKVGDSKVWRSPLRGGSIQLAGESLRYEEDARYFLTVQREPWWEDAGAASSLGSHALRSRTPIVLTGPAAGTLAAPLALTVTASAGLTAALRVHLFEDRAAPASWTPAYEMAASGTVSGTRTGIAFAPGRPTGKNLGRAQLYQPVLMATTAANEAVVRARRNQEAVTVGYGTAAAALVGETEVGALGRLGGRDSIFTGAGLASVEETTAYYVATIYAGLISGTDWRLVNAPAAGYLAAGLASGFSGSGALAGGEGLYAGPSERVVLLPLIETLGASGAEYTGTVLTLAATTRPRVSEVI